jgi:hypothetical protein
VLLRYRCGHFVNALQWSVGLQLFLHERPLMPVPAEGRSERPAVSRLSAPDSALKDKGFRNDTFAQIPVACLDSGEHSLPFLELLRDRPRREEPALAHLLPPGANVRRYCGDLASGGTGELLVFT